LHFQEPVLTAHSSPKGGTRSSTEDAERGYIFWRIGEKPILQKPHGFVIELPERL
jgi:proteasome lid subunit RPN8/RPN11